MPDHPPMILLHRSDRGIVRHRPSQSIRSYPGIGVEIAVVLFFRAGALKPECTESDLACLRIAGDIFVLCNGGMSKLEMEQPQERTTSGK